MLQHRSIGASHPSSNSFFLANAVIIIIFIIIPHFFRVRKKQCNKPTMMMVAGILQRITQILLKKRRPPSIRIYILYWMCVRCLVKPKAKAAFVLILQTVFCVRCLGTANTKKSKEKSQKIATKIAIDFGVWSPCQPPYA